MGTICRKLSIFGLSLALLIGSHFYRPLERLVTGTDAFQGIALRYSITHDVETSIEIPEEITQRPILLIHGFAASRAFWGNPMNAYSPYSIASSHYDGNVMIASYPSTASIDDIAERLNDIIRENVDERIDVLGYSLGGLVARRMVREDPELFESVGLVATPHKGFEIAPITPIARFLAPRYMSSALEDYELEYTPSELEGMREPMKGSSFLQELNTSKSLSHQPVYNHFVFSHSSGRRYIRGDDDLLLSTSNTDPRRLISEGNIEDVIHGSISYFIGDVNHFSSFHHPHIAENVISKIKYGTDRSMARYGVESVHENEIEFRRRLRIF